MPAPPACPLLQGPPAPGHTADLEAPGAVEMHPRFSLSDHDHDHHDDHFSPVVGKSKVCVRGRTGTGAGEEGGGVFFV